MSLKFIPEGPVNNIPALFQIMTWRRGYTGFQILRQILIYTFLLGQANFSQKLFQWTNQKKIYDREE